MRRFITSSWLCIMDIISQLWIIIHIQVKSSHFIRTVKTFIIFFRVLINIDQFYVYAKFQMNMIWNNKIIWKRNFVRTLTSIYSKLPFSWVSIQIEKLVWDHKCYNNQIWHTYRGRNYLNFVERFFLQVTPEESYSGLDRTFDSDPHNSIHGSDIKIRARQNLDTFI